jgi:hypothetical protein
MLDKKINFILTESDLNGVAEFPSPAIKNLPEWYKKTSPYVDGEKTYSSGNANATIKKCIPVLDALSTGYIIKTWTDVHFSENSVTWSLTDPRIPAVEGHTIDQLPYYPIQSFYKKEAFKWTNPWKIETPKGYSCLFITPIGHHLPFKIIEGIVDTDEFPLTINFPFFLNNNFTGVIPYNTPMVQVIPFKRDSFKSDQKEFKEKEYKKLKNFHHRTFINRYKLNWWNRKEFK